MKTFWPGFTLPTSTSACHAVSPTSGMDAASAMVRFSGFSATSASLIAMNSANVPIRSIARPRIDLVADLEPPDLGASPDHRSGDVVPEDEGRTIGENTA